MTLRLSHLIAASVVTFSLSTFTLAKEQKLERSRLPAAVAKTVQANSAGAEIKGFSTEVEHGKRTYEVEMVANGHTRDIEIAEDGTLNEIEEEVAFDSLPPAVQTALTAKAAGAKIIKVESLTKKDKLVAYEAATMKGTKKGEIQVGPQGGKLSHEE